MKLVASLLQSAHQSGKGIVLDAPLLYSTPRKNPLKTHIVYISWLVHIVVDDLVIVE